MSPDQQETNSRLLLPYLLLACSSLFWSLNFIIGKLLVGAIPPASITFLRWLPPALFFLVLNRHAVRRHLPLIKEHLPLLMILGLTGYTINSVCVYKAVTYTTTINTSFINSFTPVFIALLGYLMYRYPISRRQACGFFLALSGVITIIFKGKLLSILELRINIGDFFMLGNVLFWSIHTLIYKKKSATLPVNVMFTMMMCCGVILTLPLVLIESSTTGLAWIGKIELSHMLGLVAMIIFPSVLAYRFWNQALVHVSANEVAISQYLIPVFTTLISVSFLDEQLRGFHLWGGSLIFLGVFLVTRCRINKKQSEHDLCRH